MYRYLLFDLDGTLTDSREGIINCARYAIETLGLPMPEEKTMLKFIGPPLRNSFMEYCGCSWDQATEAVEVFRRRYGPVGQYENRPAPGIVEAMGRLEKAGRVMALASSKPEEQCLSICRRFGFAPYLAATVGNPPAAEWTKADVIAEALRRLGLTKDDLPGTLMIGDRGVDVAGARSQGIDCLGVEFFGYAEPGELARAGAVAVVETVEEMEAFLLSH